MIKNMFSKDENCECFPLNSPIIGGLQRICCEIIKTFSIKKILGINSFNFVMFFFLLMNLVFLLL